jgi:hypothetical protein
MSSTNPVLKAAAPALIAALQAFQQFETDMGPATEWVQNYPGAKLKLLGELALQLPQLEIGEGTALETIINTTTSGWITKLKAL